MNLVNRYPRISVSAAALVILLAVISLVRNATRSPYPEEMDAYYKDMAVQLQLATEGLPPDAELVVMLHDLDYELGDKGKFRRALRSLKDRGFSILQVEPLVFTEDGGWSAAKSGFPYGEYLRVVREHEGADAVVSLCGVPYGFNRVRSELPAERPPLLVAMDETPNDRLVARLLEEGWIQAAVMDRSLTGQDVPEEERFVRISR